MGEASCKDEKKWKSGIKIGWESIEGIEKTSIKRTKVGNSKIIAWNNKKRRREESCFE
jgi:hypothetical protein